VSGRIFASPWGRNHLFSKRPTIKLHSLARIYENSLLAGVALLPALLIGYLVTFSATPLPRFESHGFHELAIAIATTLGLFVSYVSWRSYQASGEVFLRWLTAAFLIFTLVYAPHGLLTRTAHHNIWLFLLFGPASRLAMLCCLTYGLAQYGKPAEKLAPEALRRFWQRLLLLAAVLVGCVATLAFSPLASSPWLRLPMELGALLLCLAALGTMLWRRIDSPLMLFYAMALVFFAQADIAFMLAKPWDHLWWLAHAIFAVGFSILSWGVTRALLTTRSFAMAYSQEKLMRALELEKAQSDQANQALRASQIRLLAVLNGVQDGVITIDSSGVIQSFNRAAEQTFGYRSDEVVGKNIRQLMPEPYRSAHDAHLKHHAATGERKVIGQVREVSGLHKDGPTFPMELWVTETQIDGQPLFTGSVRDITARKAMEEEVRQLAFYDPLTKLPNRRLLDDRLTQVMASTKRTGCYGAMMFLDLDNFKPLNDNYGHEAGDLLLIEVAGRLKSYLRACDTVARLGGDEFIVILGELDSMHAVSLAQADAVAEKIRSAVAAPFLLPLKGGQESADVICHQCTVSIGVYLFPGSGAPREAIFKGADAAMYAAKAAGRNLIRFAPRSLLN
jgi:diguanylate cyclase (GGDEF)-like protein/PAS domain S-box-containing protein